MKEREQGDPSRTNVGLRKTFFFLKKMLCKEGSWLCNLSDLSYTAMKDVQKQKNKNKNEKKSSDVAWRNRRKREREREKKNLVRMNVSLAVLSQEKNVSFFFSRVCEKIAGIVDNTFS